MNNIVRTLSNSDLLNILCLSKKAVAIYTSAALVIEFANDAMISFWGKDRQIIGKTLEEAVPELIGQPFIPLLKEVWRTGETYKTDDQPAELLINGKLQRSHFKFEYKAIKNEQGEIYAILHTAVDITQLIITRQAIEEGLQRELKLNGQLTEANLNLQKSKDRFASLVKNAPVAITFFRGPDLIIELANQKMLELWERKEAQVLGVSILHDQHLLVEKDQAAILERVYKTRDPYFGFSIEVRLLAAFSAFKRYFDVIYQPVIGEKEEVIGVMMVATDVTEHSLSYQREQILSEQLAKSNAELAAINREMHITNEELNESQEILEIINQEMNERDDQMQFIIDAAEIGIWDLDLITLKLSGNARIKSWLGLEENADISLGDFYKVIHKDDYAYVSNGIKDALKEHSSGKFNAEFQLTIPGELLPRYIAAKGKASFNIHQEPLKFSGTMMDITERKQDEIRKNDFIGMVSHELKTPLTSLHGYTQIMQGQAKKAEDQFSIQILEKMRIQVNRMITLINGFLNISGLESGKIKLNKMNFNLNQLIITHIQESESLSSNHQLQFSARDEVEVIADRDKISSVITNFISNAIKYSPDGGLVAIKVELINHEVRVGVKDSGIGISREDGSRLFERFYRVRNGETQLISGFGIGLYLCAEIVKSHQGKIWVESILGEGSTFYFTLPCKSLSADH